MADILIVEDAPLQQLLIEQFLCDKHTVVGAVTTASSAIDFAIEHEPDLIIMDINLAESNGITTAKKIKSRRSDTKIIISTAYVSNEIKELTRTIPVDEYLVKPYSKHELLTAIEQITD